MTGTVGVKNLEINFILKKKSNKIQHPGRCLYEHLLELTLFKIQRTVSNQIISCSKYYNFSYDYTKFSLNFKEKNIVTQANEYGELKSAYI